MSFIPVDRECLPRFASAELISRNFFLQWEGNERRDFVNRFNALGSLGQLPFVREPLADEVYQISKFVGRREDDDAEDDTPNKAKYLRDLFSSSSCKK